MRLQIVLPQDVGDRIKAQAQVEHRRVRQQIEFIVIKAIRDSEAAERREPVPAEVASNA
jgi:hypothetical protein